MIGETRSVANYEMVTRQKGSVVGPFLRCRLDRNCYDLRVRTNPLYILGVLSLLVVFAEWLVRRSVLRHIGTALLVILLAAVAANLGIIPAGSTDAKPVPVYDGIFTYVAPISIFWLLLSVHLRDVWKVGGPMIALFLVGSLGIVAGVVVGMSAVQGATRIGQSYAALAGMFAATDIGGSVNFNALALHYNVVRNGPLYGGAVVVDNVITTVWMVATLALPRLLAPLWLKARSHQVRPEVIVELSAETETIDPRKLAAVVAVGAGALWISDWANGVLAEAGFVVPTILIITILSLILAQFRSIGRLPGVRVLAMYAVYLFLAVIGAFCDVRALAQIGRLGVVLLAFNSISVTVHAVITFGIAWLFRMDLDGAAVVSQANVGGSTSALALAKSLGREDLLVPGILLGSVGNAIGTFLGFWAVRLV
jgi:uncharacterized membrane protein